MSEPAAIQSAQHRLARHYLDKLHQANAAISLGHGSRVHWLGLVEQDWGQIKHWQAWSASGTGQDAERARLCSAFSIATADVLRARQTPSENYAWVQQALEAARKLGDNDSERVLLYQLGIACLNLEDYEDAEKVAHQLMQRAVSSGDLPAQGRAWYVQGSANVLQGRYDIAETALQNALESTTAQNMVEEMGRIWRGLGRVAMYRGDYQQAFDYHQKYSDIVAQSGNAREMGAVGIALCGLLLNLHDFPAAEAAALSALEIARTNGFPRMLPPALMSVGEVETELGRLDDALAHYEEGIAAARAISPPSTILYGLLGLGRLQIMRGDAAAGMASFQEALALARRVNLLFRTCEVELMMMMGYLATNQLDVARSHLVDVIRSAMTLNTAHFMAAALGTAVMLWAQAGDFELAALWAGTLSNYPQNLHPALFDESVLDRIEQALGVDRYGQLIRQGRSLSLDSALTQVLVAIG
jgi:tetratricopeptide (TPR) repeat protein